MEITLGVVKWHDDATGDDRADRDGGEGRVSFFDRAYTDLKGRGVHIRDAPHLIARMPDHELWMAFFHDGEGNTLALMHEKRG